MSHSLFPTQCVYLNVSRSWGLGSEADGTQSAGGQQDPLAQRALLQVIPPTGDTW